MISRIKRKKKIDLQVYSEYLSSGKYSLDYILSEGKYIFCNKDSKSNIKELFVNKSSILKQSIIKALIIIFGPKTISVQGDSKIINGCVLISRKCNIKIFYFNQHKVITIYDSEEVSNRVKDSWTYFRNFYNTTYCKVEGRVTHENLIKYKEKASWTKSDYEYVFKTLNISLINRVKYHRSKSFDVLNITEEFDNYGFSESRKNLIILENIHPIISKDEKYPYIRSHGDLTLSNVLLETKHRQVFLIDFEDSTEYVFFYDFFDPMFMEALTFNNYSFIENYFLGMYDSVLKVIFSELECNYGMDLKFEYFYMFYLNKVKNLNNIIDENEFNRVSIKYRSTLQTIYDLSYKLQKLRRSI